MNDQELLNCNKTELLSMAQAQGLPRLAKSLPKETLVAIVSGEINPTREHFAGTVETRAKLEETIQQYIDRVRNQLPGCDGRCTKFSCTEARHALCFGPNKDAV